MRDVSYIGIVDEIRVIADLHVVLFLFFRLLPDALSRSLDLRYLKYTVERKGTVPTLSFHKDEG